MKRMKERVISVFWNIVLVCGPIFIAFSEAITQNSGQWGT